MNYKFNHAIEILPPSASLALMDKARVMKAEGMNIISLAGGEPDFDTPAKASLAGIKGISEGHTHYTASRGILPLRKKIAKKLNEENGIICDENNILITPGGKTAIYVAIRTLINNGDEVMILDPSWVSYAPMVIASGGIPIHVNLTFEKKYEITMEALEENVSLKSRVLIINSPNNPTGRVFTKKEIDIIADFANAHDLMVISDEIYERIVFDGRKNISLASNPAVKDRVITINGFSKSLAMTGWRLGYLAADRKVVDMIYKLYQHVLTCVGEYVQEAGLEALDCKDEIEKMRQSYQTRRDSFITALNKITGVSCLVPEGAFYAWVQIDYKGMDANQISAFLLEKAHVVAVPGFAYGNGGDKCIRMCFATATQDLEEASKRIANALQEK